MEPFTRVGPIADQIKEARFIIRDYLEKSGIRASEVKAEDIDALADDLVKALAKERSKSAQRAAQARWRK